MVMLLFAVSAVTFALFAAGPSDPARMACGKVCPPDKLAKVHAGLGLDEPLVVQYLEYMKGVVVGRDIGPPSARRPCDAPCFGMSYQTNTLVLDKITQAFPYTLSITVGAAALWVLIGVPLGLLAGLRKGSWIDKATAAVASVGMSIPLPVVALGLIWLWTVKFKLLPAVASASNAPWDVGGPTKWVTNYLLVWVTIAVLYAASYIRITRASIVETMGEDYIRTAKAKGLPWRTVTFKHGLRPSITPIVTLFGLDLAGLIGGTILAETIFGVPGLGQLTERAESDGDLPVILAVVLISAFFVIVANVVVDIVYAVIDPRVQLS